MWISVNLYIIYGQQWKKLCETKKKTRSLHYMYRTVFESGLIYDNINFDHITVHDNLHSAWDPNFEY